MGLPKKTLFERVTDREYQTIRREVEQKLNVLDARVIYVNLSVLGELRLHYSARVDVWHASCAGVMVDDGTCLYPMSGPGRFPDEAIQAYWVAATTLPDPHRVVINATRADRRRCRWSEQTQSWLFES